MLSLTECILHTFSDVISISNLGEITLAKNMTAASDVYKIIVRWF